MRNLLKLCHCVSSFSPCATNPPHPMKKRIFLFTLALFALFFLLFNWADFTPDRSSGEKLAGLSEAVANPEEGVHEAERESTTGSRPKSKGATAGGVYENVGLGGFPEGKGWEPPRAVDSEFSIPQLKQRKKLQLVTNRVAVREVAGEPAKVILRNAGFEETDLKSHPIQGWSLVRTDGILGENRGPDAIGKIVDLVGALAGDDEKLAFSSPVFVDPELGGLLVVTPTILMGFHEESTPATRGAAMEAVPEVKAAVEKAGVDLVGSYVKIPLEGVRNGFEVLEMVNALADQDAVLYAEPDMIFEGLGALVPNDPLFGNCWGLRNTGQSGGQNEFDMDADNAWDVTLGAASIKVLIIDTGVQQNHPDINQDTGKDFTSEKDSNPNGGPVNSFDNHGTPVAGCVSGRINNAIGAVGVAPACRSVSARCMITSNADGNWTGSYSWTADALNWADGQSIRVSNNSNRYGATSSAIETAYTNTKAKGMVHFASAGNSGVSSLEYPASLGNVNGIAASNRNGGRASFSQYGTGLAFTAPGESIQSADRTGSSGYESGDYTLVDGTSFASPYAAGVAALVLSVNPWLTAAEVETILRTTAVDLGSSGYDTGFGYGQVNALFAVNKAKNERDDDYEENDVRTSSFNISNDEQTWLTNISGKGRLWDEDWYRIFVTSDFNRVLIDCRFTDDEGDVDIELYDSGFNYLAGSVSTSDNEYIDHIVSPSGGTFYIRVYNVFTPTGNEYDLWWDDIAPPFVDLDDPVQDFTSVGGSHSVGVSSNADWTWSRSHTWVTSVESSPQNGNQTFSYSVSPNTSVSSRSATITFTSGSDVETHIVNQLGVPPNTPSSFTVTQQGGNAIFLNWSPTTHANSYDVWRGTSADTATMTYLVNTASTGWVDSSVSSGDRYYYSVVASNSNGYSGYAVSQLGILYGLADSMVKAKRVLGDNIYGTYAGQTAKRLMRGPRSGTFVLILENESVVGSEFFLTRSKRGNSKFQVSYRSLSSGWNVTGQIVPGRLDQLVTVGTPERILAVVKPKRRQRSRKGKITLTASTRFLDFEDSSDIGRMIFQKVR